MDIYIYINPLLQLGFSFSISYIYMYDKFDKNKFYELSSSVYFLITFIYMYSFAKPLSFYLQNYYKIYNNDIIFSYNNVYQINKKEQIISYIFCIYQFVNLFIFSMIIPKYKTTINFIHHICAFASSYLSYIGYFNYYVSYYAVYVETSTLFLTFNEIIKIIDFDTPKLKKINHIFFIITFIFFRIILWTINTLFVLNITSNLFNHNIENNIFILYSINSTNIILSILQYYWIFKIIQKFKKIF